MVWIGTVLADGLGIGLTAGLGAMLADGLGICLVVEAQEERINETNTSKITIKRSV